MDVPAMYFEAELVHPPEAVAPVEATTRKLLGKFVGDVVQVRIEAAS